MRHGYTNETIQTGGTVTKTYLGRYPTVRQNREEAALRMLAGRIPVPELIASEPGRLTMAYVAGAHGQDLIDQDPVLVLSACGRVLRQLHAVPVGFIATTYTGVIVHGDFGPNNVLIRGDEVVALLDWEFSGPGEAIRDLAWCEWIVRTHHPEQRHHLDAFYTAYGSRPKNEDVKQAAYDRCEKLLQFSEAKELWQQRRDAVREWD